MTTDARPGELKVARLAASSGYGAASDAELEFRFDHDSPSLVIGRQLPKSVVEELAVGPATAAAVRLELESLHPTTKEPRYGVFGDAREVTGTSIWRDRTATWAEWGQALTDEQHAFAAALLRAAWKLSRKADGQRTLATLSFDSAMELPEIPVIEQRTNILEAEFLWIATDEQSRGFEEWLRTVPDEGTLIFHAFNATTRLVGIRDLSRLAELTKRRGSTTIHCHPSQVQRFREAGVPEANIVTDDETIALMRWRDPPRRRRPPKH